MTLLKRLGLPVLIAAGAMTLTAAGAFAQDQQAAPAEPVDPNAVVATVNGETITEADLSFAAEDLAQDLQQIPPASRRAFLTSILVDMKVMAAAARVQNMQDTEEFQRRLDYLEDRSLRRAYFSEKIAASITEEAARAAYDEQMAAFEPVEEIRARHILVQDEELIKKIKAEIEGGKPFEIAASENSIDGSAQNGGDLGYFRKGQMVPPFEEAAFALEPGQVSEPVQSQFGWHLIKLEDKRMSSPPPFEQVAAQFQQQALVDAFDAELARLKEGAEIQIEDEALATQMNSMKAE